MPQEVLLLPTVHQLKTQDLILFPPKFILDSPKSLALTLVPRQTNGYRQYIQSHAKAFRSALSPLVEEHGIGLVGIVCVHETDTTKFKYIPKNLCNNLVKEALVNASGEMLWFIVEQALHFFNWPTVIPVLGMSTTDEIPSFLFLQDFSFSINKKGKGNS